MPIYPELQALTATEWTALATSVQALAVLVSGVFIFWQVREAKRLREQQARPFVVVSLVVEQKTLLLIEVRNIGSTPAYDVSVELQPTPEFVHKHGLARVFREPTPVLPPGHRLRATWNLTATLLDKAYSGPTTVTATVTCSQGPPTPPRWWRRSSRAGKRIELPAEEYVLDVGMLRGAAIERPGLAELATAVQEVANSQSDIAKWYAHRNVEEMMTNHSTVAAQLQDKDERGTAGPDGTVDSPTLGWCERLFGRPAEPRRYTTGPS